MADAVGGENFENNGEDGTKNGEQMETERVVEGEEDKEENEANVKVETRRYLPWKIIYQNIRRLETNQNKERVEFFEELGRNEEILFMNFTETWFNGEIEGCPEMKGYKLYRGDRSHRQGGGTAIYVKGKFEAQKIAEMSTNEIEMVAVFIKKLNIVIYRPPGAKGRHFSEILEKVKEILEKVKSPEPSVNW